VLLAPDQAECHVRLADAFEELGNWREALRWYRTARRLDPGWPVPQLGAAAVHLRLGATGAALELLETLYRRTGGAEPVGDHWAGALVAVAEQVPVVREDDVYFVTRRSEIRAMRPLLAHAAAVATDPDLAERIARIRRYVGWCRRRELTARWLRHPGNPWPYAALGGLGAGAPAAAAFLWTGAAWLAGVAVAVLAAGLFAGGQAVLIPRWRLNGWAYDRQTPGDPRRPDSTG
jgi:tetratricopeptide (TPR) repeat protein